MEVPTSHPLLLQDDWREFHETFRESLSQDIIVHLDLSDFGVSHFPSTILKNRYIQNSMKLLGSLCCMMPLCTSSFNFDMIDFGVSHNKTCISGSVGYPLVSCAHRNSSFLLKVGLGVNGRSLIMHTRNYLYKSRSISCSPSAILRGKL